MKFKRLLLAAALLCTLASALAIGPAYIYQLATGEYLVAASDAPWWIRQVAWATCSGTNDEVEIQAAIDAAATVGGTVELSGGTFTVSKPSGAEEYGGTATATDGVASFVLDTFVWDGTDTIAEVTVGEMIAVTDGDEGGDSMIDDMETVIATVTAKDATTITLSEDLGGHTYTTASFDRIVPCITLHEKVQLLGQGRTATTIKLADAQDCTIVAYERGTSNVVGSQIKYIAFDGNGANQTAAAARLCNGIVLNRYAIDWHIYDIKLISCIGDGVYLNNSWGYEHFEGWVEYCGGSGDWATYMCGAGIVVASQSGSKGGIIAVKSMLNDGPAIFLRRASGLTITGGCHLRSNEDYALRLLASNANTVTANHIQSTSGDGTPVGGIFFDAASLYNTFTGNMILADTGVGIYPVGPRATITGNSFVCDSATAIVDTGSYFLSHNIVGNAGLSAALETRCGRMKNTSGASIAAYLMVDRRAAANQETDSNEFALAVAASGQCVGQLQYAACADNALGLIGQYGHTHKGPMDEDNASNNTTDVDKGDPLRISTTTNGMLELADTSSDIVVAIYEGADNYASAGAPGSVTYKEVYILPPGMRWLIP